jgi:endoglucanase Acf2
MAALVMGLILMAGVSAVYADTVRVGAGHYTTHLRAGGEREPPAPRVRAAGPTAPVPTNQWYSSLLFDAWPQPLYAFPGSFRPTHTGFEIDTPVPESMLNGAREENDVQAGHRASLVVVTPFELKKIRAGRTTRWTVEVVMGDGTDSMAVTLAHGSPYSQYRTSSREVTFRAKDSLKVFRRSKDGRALGILAKGKPMGLYAPLGSQWEVLPRAADSKQETSVSLRLPEGKGFFSVAALPDQSESTFKLFHRHAYAFITDTLVQWSFDEERSQLTTTFTAVTEAMEGDEHATLLGLFPHQWHDNPLLGSLTELRYETLRGPINLLTGNKFQTQYTYHGILPFWPAPGGSDARDKLESFLTKDMRFGGEFLLGNRGTYWEGKGLNRAAQVMSIAEQLGRTDERDDILKAMKKRMELWFKPKPNAERYFHYNQELGALIGYPDEYGSADQLNDHHFHYSYWINAAAQIALRDPAWSESDAWGGMVELLIGDIANADPKDTKFPLLRHFDPYEGHSWASGNANFFDGNNQESSSEAVYAWAGLILWGEITGNKALRDTGIYLYTTEIASLSHYWFDHHGIVFHPEYSHVDACIVWGGKYVHTTWWSDDPREVHGINFLPLTGASTYLGRDPDYLQRNLDAMDAEFDRFLRRGGRAPRDIWQDILLQTFALADPVEALSRWNPQGYVEDGETRTHTFHWFQSLVEMGTPDFSVIADAALYGVFKTKDGVRTYLAYNASELSSVVTFSDGTRLKVAPHSLARRRAVPQ